MDRSPLHHQTNKSSVVQAQNHHDPKQFQVICRVRPLQSAETPSDIAISPNAKTITIQSQAKNNSKEFTFDKIYEENITQADFTFQMSEAIFNNCRQKTWPDDSENVSLVLSYGVTNSGKTYTILGTEEEPGLLPVLVQRIEQEFPEAIINITAVEIYNDQFFSLKDKQKLFPKQSWGTYQFSDYQPEKITKVSTKAMMKQYMVNRNQTDTHSNKKSSRSHAIFKIVCGRISIAIVDLAGSERLSKANANIQETSAINGSLLVLGKCLHAFRDGAIIPFRECKLTRVLSEYFLTSQKIWMIAHINRSGEMFHQNLKVLEYAAVSTLVKPINLQANRSILKSVCKKKSLAAKSVMKYKMNITSDDEDEQLEVKSCYVTKKDLKKEEIPISPEMKQLKEVMEKADKKRRRTFMEKYINQMIGRMQEFDYYLDRQFAKEDESDRKFISEMQSCVYESPSKKAKVGYEIKEAKARISLRKEILNELEEEKKGLRRDASTNMGPSMRKCLQQSIRKDIERQKQMGLVSQKQEREKMEQIEKLQIQKQEDDQNWVKDNEQLEQQVQIEQDSLKTPIKIDCHNEQSQSYFKRAMNNPNILFESGYKAIKSAGEVLNAMMESFSKVVHENKKNPNRDLRHVVKTMQRLAVCKPQSLNISISGSIECANKENQIQEREIKKMSLKQFNERGVGSGNIKELSMKKMDQYTEIGVDAKQLSLKKIELKEFHERGVGSGNVKDSIFFEEKEKSLCQMMKQLESRSETNDQDSRPQSVAFSSVSVIQSIPESRESEQFYDRNSPFFQIPEQPKEEQEHHQIASKSLFKAKQSSQQEEVSEDYEEITFKNGGLKGARLQSQESMFSSQTNSGSQPSYEPLKKSKNTTKSRYNRKPLKQTTQMEFVIDQKKDISPLKTRSGRTVSQTRW